MSLLGSPSASSRVAGATRELVAFKLRWLVGVSLEGWATLGVALERLQVLLWVSRLSFIKRQARCLHALLLLAIASLWVGVTSGSLSSDSGVAFIAWWWRRLGRSRAT